MSMHGLPSGIVNPPRPVTEADEQRVEAEHGRFGPTPGTVILVAIFLIAFATYYFTNWKLLSFLWQIG
jgi:hypothetical protein